MGVIMNLIEITYTKLSILYENSENEATLFFIGEKNPEKPYAKIVEDPC